MAVDRDVAELLVRYFSRRIGHQDAEDCASDALVVLWRKRHSSPKGAAFMPWVYGVARNVLRSYWRQQEKRGLLVEFPLDARERVQSGTPLDLRRDLMAALQRLSMQDRELVLLVAWEGLTVRAAAAALGLSDAAGRKRYERVKRRLKADLTA